jgi:hypothetical protein
VKKQSWLAAALAMAAALLGAVWWVVIRAPAGDVAVESERKHAPAPDASASSVAPASRLEVDSAGERSSRSEPSAASSADATRASASSAHADAAKLEIRGTVTDEKGTPLAGVQVTMRSIDDEVRTNAATALALTEISAPPGGRTSGVTQSDGQGSFAFARLPAGKYALGFNSPCAESPGERTVELATGVAPEEVRVVMKTGNIIEGRVVAPDGRGVKSVTIVIRQLADSNARPLAPGDVGPAFSKVVLTRDNGAFCILGAPPGRYSLHFTPGDARASGGVFDVLATDVAEVATGTRNLLVTLPRAGVIEGVVLASDGQPCAGARVMAQDPRGQLFEWVMSDDLGRFHLRVGGDADVVLVAWKTEAERRDRGEKASNQTDMTARMPGIVAGTKNVVLRLAPRQ